jgi:6,7-dimethyl-8-ribityllumazine synthase
MAVKLGFVVGEFNRDITYMMEVEGREHAKFLGAEVTETLYVPGTFDVPFAVKKMLAKGKVDAVVTLGAVIEGATQHDEVVIQHAARKIMDLALEFGKPVTLGISGPGMRIDYAKRAVESAVKLVQRLG